MPLRSDWSQRYCPVSRSLDAVGDPWVLVIVREVLHGRGRFDQLRASLGISEAVLSRRLKDMVAAGLIRRVPYDGAGRGRFGYVTTEAGAELLPILQQLALWGERHTAMPAGSGHMEMVHRACGAETVHGEVCSGCGELLTPEQMTWIKPWKAGSPGGAAEHLVGAGVLGPLEG